MSDHTSNRRDRMSERRDNVTQPRPRGQHTTGGNPLPSPTPTPKASPTPTPKASTNASPSPAPSPVPSPVPSNVIRITQSPAVYTVAEVSQLLSLSRGMTYAIVRSGEIPAKKIGDRWIVPKARFHEWLNECAVPALTDELDTHTTYTPTTDRRNA